MNELISAHRRFEDFFRELSRLLSRIIPFEGISITIYDIENQTTKLYLSESGKQTEYPDGRIFPMQETSAPEILKDRKPIYMPDIEKDARFPAILRILQQHGIRSYCVLPLSSSRGCMGGLHFGSSKPEAYTAEDIEFLQLVARQAAVVLENILTYESQVESQRELARERDHLRLLLQVNDAVADKLDTRELFSAISVCLREALNVEYASLTLFDAQNRCLKRHSLDFPGGGGILQQDAVIPIENTTVGEAFTKAIPVVARRAEIERHPPEIAGGLLGEGLNFLCAVPLISRKRVLGTLNVASRREDAFSETGIELLKEVACQFAVALDNAFAYRHIEELNSKLAEEKLYLADEIRRNLYFEEIIGTSQSLQKVLRQVEVVAPSNSTVLIFGETGTGKELVARAIHNLSTRRQSTFVKLNCAAIPTGLMESEMFGHEKGAFTGAVAQRIGRFELANHGTLFLDEIGEIPAELQPKLLRVLQEQEFERLGSARTVHVDVRLVAATNKDLQSMVKDGEFRADLFYRLNVFPIVMPPLRERREDIPKLVRYFVQQVAQRMGKHIETIHSETMEELVRYPWPGNVRELQNIIERAVILSSGTVLRVPPGELSSSAEVVNKNIQTLEEADRSHILQALEETHWIIGGPHGAAARLGMKRSTLQSRMQKLRILRPH
ncbi:MAG: sigma 54-interacting transcriptional regulator [Acidobacteria bacterium]|nr:sigma 54-interacting transcriptional regulator [Acidobacteriota bacterium]